MSSNSTSKEFDYIFELVNIPKLIKKDVILKFLQENNITFKDIKSFELDSDFINYQIII